MRWLRTAAAMHCMVAATLLAQAAAAADKTADAEVRITGSALVIDGDTLEIGGHRIRLFGVDAPELAQQCTRPSGAPWACGEQAKTELDKLLRNTRVDCLQRDVDRYRRIVAVCSAGARDINAVLAAGGWVVAYREYSTDYVDEELQAKNARRGLWSGSFDNPQDYRIAQDRAAEAAVTQPSANCRIKGNINSGGDRIFHVQGGEFYENTQIDAAAGERWFCSEREAREAGWRKSRR